LTRHSTAEFALRIRNGRLPENFVPKSAVLCATVHPALPSGVSAPAQPVRRSTGPFDDLLKALREPPPAEAADGELACPAMLQAPILLALTDASGHTLLPAIPATECGFRTPAVDAASKRSPGRNRRTSSPLRQYVRHAARTDARIQKLRSSP
jgi:hypothetical protein